METFTVINETNKDRYTVASYNLKVLKCNLPDLAEVDSGVVHQGFKTFEEIETLDEAKEKVQEKETGFSEDELVDPEAVEGENQEAVNESHDELIESLLKKADDFSSKYLKAQMDLDSFKEEALAKEESIRAAAFKEGQESAMQEASAAAEQLQSDVLGQLQTSIDTLTQNSAGFSEALQSVKEELVAAALEIAKEVIVKELEENSNQMALDLANSLIKEIDSKSDITLKVHPNQLDIFTQALAANSRITISADPAVSEGGVIVLSQMGTIEADIMQRFEHIKRNALKA